jgi:hypothetical protein
MKKPAREIEVTVEFSPAPDAAERLGAAFDLILSHSPGQDREEGGGGGPDLTENFGGGTMTHDGGPGASPTPATFHRST